LATVLLVISSVASQYQAVGMKNFHHQRVAQVDIFAKVLSFVFAISFSHLELLCLVGATIVYQLARLVGFMMVLGREVNLTTKVNTAIYREAFNYGIFDFGSQALNILRRQLDVIILAVTLPSNELGVYHVIKQLASRPAQALQPIIGKVALPAFAEVKENETRFARVYKDFFILQLFVLAIIYIPVIIASDLVTALFFGTDFVQHSWVLSILSIFWFTRVASSNLVGPLVQATGFTKRNFLWNVILLLPNTLVIYVSSQYGVVALVSAMAVFQLILFPIVNYYFILFITNVSFSFSVKNMLVVVASLAVPLGILKYFVLPFIPEVFLVKEIIVAMLTFAVAAMLLVFFKELKSSLIRVKGF
jgi:O-antigen/teichoic acid export membrane protein